MHARILEVEVNISLIELLNNSWHKDSIIEVKWFLLSFIYIILHFAFYLATNFE